MNHLNRGSSGVVQAAKLPIPVCKVLAYKLCRFLVVSVAVCALSAVLLSRSQEPPPYRNASLPVETRARDLLARMTLEEKFWQLFMIPGDLDNPANDYSHGIFGLQIGTVRRQAGDGASPAALARAHAERINAIQRYFVEKTRLGVPIIPFDEAVHGIQRDGATVFPQAIALAATWDTGLMERVAGAIADETRTRGIRDVLSPVVNIADDVRWGRVEETYGEDPYLVSAMARAFVSTFEKKGVVTTPKHFVANVGEGGRDSYPIGVSERTLAERYFPPFLAAIRDAGARSVMTSYNSVDGAPATQNQRLLNGILKGDWGFRGFVISDASATSGATVLHMTEADTASSAKDAMEAGLDVVFQSQYGQQRPYLDAFQRGLIAQEIIDAAVARVLRVKFELGLFERPYVNPDAAAAANASAQHRALSREAARASIVLLKNDHNVLPLAKTIRSIAVIGTDAEEARLGGYSGPGAEKESILAGMRQILGSSAAIRYASGPGRVVPDFVVVPAAALGSQTDGKDVRGLTGEYFDNPRFEGRPRLTRTDQRMDFRWTLNSPGRGIPFDWYSIRWTGSITAPADGVRRLGVEANDGYRLYLDGKLVIDDWIKRSYGRRTAEISWLPGSRHEIKIEYFESSGNARLRLLWDAGVKDDSSARIDQAVAVAKESDAAVVVAGLEEGEFRDRAKLGLPGRQEDMIQAVARTGKPTIVVLIGGSAITMSPWLDQVDAVIDAWYPGEAGGPAIADVLFGDANPAGRLPITFPVFEGQLPLYYNHKPTGRGDDYNDLTGMPLFPFGFGLSYTTFVYADLAIDPAEIGASDTLRARCTVQNTGTRSGDEVVQLYLRDVLASVARPVIELKGFRRVHLAQGERTTVAFTLGPAELRMLDRNMKWVVEPGAFRVLIGSSSKDIRLRGEFTVR
jgi:beta-glucosidase